MSGSSTKGGIDMMKDNVPFTFSLHPKLLEKVRKTAHRRGVTVTGLIRIALERECQPVKRSEQK